MKKIFILLSMLLFPIITFADGIIIEAMIDKKAYEKLETAMLEAKDGDTIKVMRNVTLEDTLLVNKNVTIDLNEHNIEAPKNVMKISKGNLKVTGKGKIKETVPAGYAISLVGSTIKEDEDYSSIEVGKDVTIEAWRPIYIGSLGRITVDDEEKVFNSAYGVNVKVMGTLNSVSNQDEKAGSGIYIDTTVINKESFPTITLDDGTIITSNGPGIYLGGYAKLNINEAKITGVFSGVSIKSGAVNIDGADITATGSKGNEDEYKKGGEKTGATIQIESNSNFAGSIGLNIANGKFTSLNTYALLEYVADKSYTTSVSDIAITNGTFVSKDESSTIKMSTAFDWLNKKFVTGGLYTKSPQKYVKSGYKVITSDEIYKVVSNDTVAKIVDNPINEDANNKNILPYIFIPIAIGLLAYGIFYIMKKRA